MLGAASVINELNMGWVNGKLKSENDLGFSGSPPRVFIWSNYWLLSPDEVKTQAGSGLLLPLSPAGTEEELINTAVDVCSCSCASPELYFSPALPWRITGISCGNGTRETEPRLVTGGDSITWCLFTTP